jgi:hypothetical protein
MRVKYVHHYAQCFFIHNLTPALRHGEVLVADSGQIAGWRNLGQSEAVLFWIVIGPSRAAPARGGW